MGQEGEDFLAAIALALLLGVSVIVVLQIIAELVVITVQLCRM